MKSPSLRAACVTTLLAIVPVSVCAAGSSGATSTTTASVTRYTNGVTNVRTGPSTSYRVAATLPAKATVTGVLSSNGWIRISTPSADAGRYVSAAVLSSSAPSAPPVATDPTGTTGTSSPSGTTVTGWVASSDHAVQVRTSPSLDAAVATTLAPKAKVVGTLTGDWVKISSGYVNAGVLEFSSSNPFTLNGRISTSSLCPLPSAWNTPASFAPNYTPTTTRYLNCAALNGLSQLGSAYQARFGHVAYIDLAYRDLGEQGYWYRKLGSVYAAAPGTSNHGWGLAVDFREQNVPDEFTWGQPGYQWLAANAGRYGFTGDPVAYGTPHESYHWNFSG